MSMHAGRWKLIKNLMSISISNITLPQSALTMWLRFEDKHQVYKILVLFEVRCTELRSVITVI